jgi:hypothetical protein
MRLILAFLARANVRWASADLTRAERLAADIRAAQDSAEARLQMAGALAVRARSYR